MKTDALGNKLEGMVKRLLTEARVEPFENKIDAIKLAIVWFSASRKLGGQEDTSGALLEEMRKAIDGSTSSGRGTNRDGAGNRNDRPAATAFEAGAATEDNA